MPSKNKVVESERQRPQAICLIRYVSRYISRALMQTLLIVLISAGFMFTLGWMRWAIEQNTMELDRLYITQTVEGEIIRSNSSVSTSGGGYISREVVDTIIASGFVQRAHLEAASRWTLFDIETDDFLIYAFDQPALFFSQEENRFITTTEQLAVDEYVAGWDESLFSGNWSADDAADEGVPAILPAWMLKEQGLELGDIVRVQKITFDNDGKVVTLHIVGQLAMGQGRRGNVLVPLSALDWMDGDRLNYTKAEFVFDPAKNRELPEYEKELKELISQPNAGMLPLRFLLWDEELRSVIKPLEKNLSLMAVLYPVTIAISMLIAAGLDFLLVNLVARDTAILRVLGVSRIRLLMALTGQQGLLSLLGVIVGLAGLAALWNDLSASISGLSLAAGGLYLVSASIGAIVGGIFITRRQPLELLQVKE